MNDYRTRSEGALVLQRTDWESEKEYCGHVGINTHNGPFYAHAHQGTTKTMHDYVTKDYRKRSRAGEVIINPYSSIRESYTATGNSFRVQYANPSCTSPLTYMEEWINGPYALYAAGLGTKLTPPALVTDLERDQLLSVATTKAWNDANQHDAEVLTDLAELGQLVSLLASPARTASQIVASAISTRGKSLSKAAGSLAMSSTDIASNLWLQYRFGVRPLVSTLNGVVDAVARYRSRHRRTARGNVSLTKSSVSSGTATYWVADFGWSRVDNHTVSVRAGMLLEEEVRFTNSLGIDASGMLKLPWELVPFSFVADWFINVGDFIGGIAPYLTKSALGSWYTIEDIRDSTWTVGSSGAPKGAWTIVRPMSGQFSGLRHTKQRFTPLAAPSVAFRPHALSKVLSDLRSLDSAALAFQRLGNIFRG